MANKQESNVEVSLYLIVWALPALLGAVVGYKEEGIFAMVVGIVIGLVVGFKLMILVDAIKDIVVGDEDKGTESPQNSAYSNEEAERRKEEEAKRRVEDFFKKMFEEIENNKAKKVDYFEILQSTPQDSFDTIKSNYRRLVREYHPDSLGSNASETIKQLAKEKAQELNEAYSYMKNMYKQS